jgi:hypothetical protein
LVTTLLDPVAYPAEALAELYLGRWQIEVNFRHLKTTMGLEVLHCKTVAGVLKEMYMVAITYNLVRLVMLEASRRQQVPLDRISFIDALLGLAPLGFHRRAFGPFLRFLLVADFLFLDPPYSTEADRNMKCYGATDDGTVAHATLRLAGDPPARQPHALSTEQSLGSGCGPATRRAP